jgi:aminoglycoside phosphotransferase family enzyme
MTCAQEVEHNARSAARKIYLGVIIVPRAE